MFNPVPITSTVQSHVVGTSPFGMRLWRLLAYRRPTVTSSMEQMQAALAQEAGVSGAELAAVVEHHVEPSPDLIRKLAPALEVHTADLFVVAGLPVPDDLASAWPTSECLGSIVQHAVAMNAEQRSRLRALVTSLPVQPPTGSAPADDYLDTPGALLLRLLRNRNLRPYNARILYAVGGGPYVSDSTIAGLGYGRVVITPQYVTAFAYLLGYRPSDMVALTGIGPVIKDAKAHPANAEIAALAWEARRLSSEQLSEVTTAAWTIRSI